MKDFKQLFLLILLITSYSLQSQTKSDSLSILYNRVNNAGLMLNQYYNHRTNGLIKTIGGTFFTTAFSIGAITTESESNRTMFSLFAAGSSIFSIMGIIDLWSSHKYIKKAGLYLNPNQSGLSLGYRF